MTTTPDSSGRDPDETQDQDAEPSLNTTHEARPDGQDGDDTEGGSTDDVI